MLLASNDSDCPGRVRTVARGANGVRDHNVADLSPASTAIEGLSGRLLGSSNRGRGPPTDAMCGPRRARTVAQLTTRRRWGLESFATNWDDDGWCGRCGPPRASAAMAHRIHDRSRGRTVGVVWRSGAFCAASWPTAGSPARRSARSGGSRPFPTIGSRCPTRSSRASVVRPVRFARRGGSSSEAGRDSIEIGKHAPLDRLSACAAKAAAGHVRCSPRS